MFPDAGHVEPSIVFLIHAFWFRINKPVHGILSRPMGGPVAVFIIGSKTSHARSSTSTPALTFVMACKRIPSGETASTFWENMRPLSCMKLCVPFQIMESPEARVASLTNIRLLLAVGE